MDNQTNRVRAGRRNFGVHVILGIVVVVFVYAAAPQRWFWLFMMIIIDHRYVIVIRALSICKSKSSMVRWKRGGDSGT
jgi:hypothetical protein